jgi:DNA-binding protein H-NS
MADLTDLDARLKAVKYNFEALPLEDLAKVHFKIARILDKKITTEMKQFRERGEQLQLLAQNILAVDKPPYRPKRVKVPKAAAEAGVEAPTEKAEPVRYRHPENDSLVWVEGNGRKPKWLNDLTRKEGWKLEDLKVKPEEGAPRAEELQSEEKAEEQPVEEPKPEEPAKEPETDSKTPASLYGNYGHRS